MHLTEEGEHVVLTEGVEVNVLDDDHLAIVLLEHRRAKDLLRGLRHTLRQEAHRLAHPFGGLDETFSLRILAQQLEDLRVVMAQRLITLLIAHSGDILTG